MQFNITAIPCAFNYTLERSCIFDNFLIFM